MTGQLTKVELKEFKTQDGNKKFRKLLFEVEVKNSKGDILTRKGSMSEEYARKYFEFCNVKTKDLIGKDVDVILAKRSFTDKKTSQEVKFEYAKFINVLDAEGKPIIMKKEEDNKGLEIDF